MELNLNQTAELNSKTPTLLKCVLKCSKELVELFWHMGRASYPIKFLFQ